MSGKMARRKGADWERKCRSYLKPWLKKYTHVGTDEPDMTLGAGGKRIMIECKNQARQDLAGWYRQATERRCGNDLAVVLHKRKGRAGVAEAWVTMSGKDFRWLLKQIDQVS